MAVFSLLWDSLITEPVLCNHQKPSQPETSLLCSLVWVVASTGNPQLLLCAGLYDLGDVQVSESLLSGRQVVCQGSGSHIPATPKGGAAGNGQNVCHYAVGVTAGACLLCCSMGT